MTRIRGLRRRQARLIESMHVAIKDEIFHLHVNLETAESYDEFEKRRQYSCLSPSEEIFLWIDFRKHANPVIEGKCSFNTLNNLDPRLAFPLRYPSDFYYV